jgi:L-fuconolactonase
VGLRRAPPTRIAHIEFDWIGERNITVTPIVDTHLHFWDLATYHRTGWMRDRTLLLQNYLPPDLKPEFDTCGVDYGIIVEAARDSHSLNLWWLSLAEKYPYIGAVVGGCALEQGNLAEWFDAYAESPYFVGVRTIPAGPAEQWSENPETARGLRELTRRGWSLDLLVGYETYPAVGELARAHPDLPIILDHCAHPPIREKRLDAWQDALAPLAAYPNIHIKYSSLLLYSYPDTDVEQLRPLTNFLFERFGVERMMWGSNWPVELLGGTYTQAFAVMQTCAEHLSAAERAQLFGGNAARFYRVVLSRQGRSG